MKIEMKQDLSLKDEIEVTVRYTRYDPIVKKLEILIRSADKTVKCSHEQEELWLNASDIYYVESIDKRTFIYGETTVYSSEQRLYQLMDELRTFGFVQVSKSCIININKLKSIKPLINSKMEATLSSGERIDVTRKYIKGIRMMLQER